MRHDVRPCVDYNWRNDVQNENESNEADGKFLEETESFLDAKMMFKMIVLIQMKGSYSKAGSYGLTW